MPVITAGGAGSKKKSSASSSTSTGGAAAAANTRTNTTNSSTRSTTNSTSTTNTSNASKQQRELTPEEELNLNGPTLEFETEQTTAEPSKPKTPEPKWKGDSASPLDQLYQQPPITPSSSTNNNSSTVQQDDTPMVRNMWLFACFFGIMVSFVCYGLLLEYATSGGRKLHELSFLFVTSGLYTLTAAAGRHVRDETPTSIPPARFAILGLTSMGSTFCSVRSLRYVIYPIQVLAKSCKPVPVMIMGAFLGKKYPLRKYLNVVMIVFGVALFMGGGKKKTSTDDNDIDSSSQIIGVLLLFVSLCFDGGTGAYEDKLMAVHHVGPFDLMYNIQLGKTILAGIGLVVLNQVHVFLQMCQDMGFLLIALGLSGALGQVFIFVTISKFGALTCSIIGLARKVTTLVASILFYGHALSGMQFTGLVVAVGAMVLNFWGKKNPAPNKSTTHNNNINGDDDTKKYSDDKGEDEEIQKLLDESEAEEEGHVELIMAAATAPKR